MLGGGSTAKALYPGVEDNLLVPWFLGDSVLDREELRGPVVEALSPVVNKLFVELYFVRIEKDNVFASPQQTTSPGLELVAYVEGEPTPLDWSQALVDGGCGGSQEVGKYVELIMAFSQIVGISCDGHTKKLRAAFAHKLDGKANKAAKKIIGGGQVGKKVLENSLTSSIQLIMREDVGVCLIVEAREGGTVLHYEVQHSFLESKRAE
jgi:hypothetical protein